MNIFILDKDPVIAAQMLPAKIGKSNYAGKMLVELNQLLSSTLILAGCESDRLYKYRPQGRELHEFILDNKYWICNYSFTLEQECRKNYDWFYNDTIKNSMRIRSTFCNHFNITNFGITYFPDPIYGYFRYKETYKCDIPSKTLLPIDECVQEYRKYLDWKIKDIK